MRLTTKLAIDRWVGTAVIRTLLLLNLTARGRANARIEPKTIFVLKLLGLGSIIQATPLLSALRTLHPAVRIVFITKSGNDQLTGRIKTIDETLTIRDDCILPLLGSIIRLLRMCHRTPDACFINLEAHSKIGAILTMLSGARWKVTFFRNGRDLIMAPAFDRMVYFNQSAPIAEVYLQLGRTIGATAASPPLADVQTLPADDADANRFLVTQNISYSNTRLVLINPNASELRLERRWPAENFVRFIQDLARAEPDLCFILIGSPAERDYVATIWQRIPLDLRSGVINAAGSVSVGGLMSLIRWASLVISNDSGPMHMALSLSTPTIGLFGPVEPDHYACNNVSGDSIFLYHRIYCSPCVHHFEVAPCGGNNICMRKITVEETLSAAQTLLRKEAPAPVAYRTISYWNHDEPIGIAVAQS